MSNLMRIDLKIYLDEKDMEVLTKEAEKHRKQQKACGQAPNWTEKDELIYGVQKRLNELKIRYGEESYDASFNRNYNKTQPVTGTLCKGVCSRAMALCSKGL